MKQKENNMEWKFSTNRTVISVPTIGTEKLVPPKVVSFFPGNFRLMRAFQLPVNRFESKSLSERKAPQIFLSFVTELEYHRLS